MSGKIKWLSAAVLAAALLGLAAPASAEWKVAGEDGSSFIKLGFLAQGRAEWEEDPGTRKTSQNLYLRRFRILMGGQITPQLSFFFETDSPNLGKYDPNTGQKVAGDMFIQDMFVTYTFSKEFMLDGGMLLIPVSHNSGQGATTLLPVDYGPYSFAHGGVTDSRVGRDYGVQARGYLFNSHLEYRLGVFQGARNLGEWDKDPPPPDADAPFRYAGRIVFHLAEPETGFFYAGTYHGKKTVFSIGFSADLQDTYKTYGADLFWDQPLASGDAVTFQFNYLYFDGDDTFTALPAQNTYLYEFGYYHGASKLGLFGQIAVRDFVQEKFQDERRWQAGLAWWGRNHNFNLKAGYTVIYQDHARVDENTVHGHVYRDQYTLQCQVFMF